MASKTSLVKHASPVKEASPKKPAKMADPFKAAPIKPTLFRFFYLRGDFNISLEDCKNGHKIKWKMDDLEKLDYHHYLPLFFDGLCEVEHPYAFFCAAGD